MSKFSHLKDCLMSKKFTLCLIFGHLVSGLILLSGEAKAQDMVHDLSLSKLNPYIRHQDRTPSNFIPNDEVWGSPVESKNFVQKIFVETNEGNLSRVREQFNEWEKTEEYARLWNLDSTGLYVVPDTTQKKAYFNRQLLKYADKRISGEVKNAEEGSTMHAIGQAQQALRPNAEAALSPSVKLKFKAKVLEGKAYLIVDNPFVDAQAQINAKGEASMNVKRSFASLGVNTEIDYQVTTETWVAKVDKSITSNLTARVSSSQSQQNMAFSSDSNRTVELVFGMPF
ncbi:MAG: hypothetical protein Fur0010_12260 [Bdellovibrio sp.]